MAAGGHMTQESMAREPSAEGDEVALAAARDVARLLDRRGLKDIVALAGRVLGDAQRRPLAVAAPHGSEPWLTICTLRQHERPSRRSAAGRAADDDQP